jgi:hypothetical protein
MASDFYSMGTCMDKSGRRPGSWGHQNEVLTGVAWTVEMSE